MNRWKGAAGGTVETEPDADRCRLQPADPEAEALSGKTAPRPRPSLTAC